MNFQTALEELNLTYAQQELIRQAVEEYIIKSQIVPLIPRAPGTSDQWENYYKDKFNGQFQVEQRQALRPSKEFSDV